MEAKVSYLLMLQKYNSSKERHWNRRLYTVFREYFKSLYN